MDDKDEIRQLAKKYLDNDATLCERARLDTWLEDDPQLHGWLSSRIDSSASTIDPETRARLDVRLFEICSPDINSSRHVQAGDSASATAPYTAKFWKWGMVASVAIVLLLSTLILSGTFSRHDPERPLIVATATGQRSEVNLPDGSRLRLNHQSRIAYHYDHEARRRVLDLSGEASFDVQTDPDRPFIVNCDDLLIECRGTSFNVKGYPEEGEVTVVLSDGVITTSTPRQAITMKPGTKVSYDKQQRNLSSSMVDPTDYNSWINGCDRFNDDRFDDILRTVARCYGVSITLLTPGLRDIRLSGSIGNKPLEETLTILASASGSKYRMDSDSIVSFYREK